MKKKLKLIGYIVLFLLLVYVVFTCFFPEVFFKNTHKTGDLTFYFNKPINYGIRTEEELNIFYRYCDDVANETLNNPFYVKKKIKIYLCDSYALFNFVNPTSVGTIGTTLTFFNYSRIVLTKSDFISLNCISSLRENNTREIKTVLLHELTHAYMNKTIPIMDNMLIPTWKEEGICEVIAGDSSYNVEEGIKRLLENNPDKDSSWDYFTYRMCVSYMMKHDGLSFDEVVKDKRTFDDVLSSLYLLTESELRELI